MPTEIIDAKAVEESTFVVTASFTDEDGVAVAPDTMFWSLMDEDGEIINDREDEEISSPGTSVDILLQGDDLAIPGVIAEVKRYLVLHGTYTSGLGSGLPLTDQVGFYVTNLKG